MSGRHDRTLVTIVAYLLFIAIGFGSLSFSGFQNGADEQAHVSYAVALAANHLVPPDLTTLHMVDEKTHEPTGEANYLNHPPTGYYPWAVALMLDPQLSLQALRGIGLVIAFSGFVVFMRFGAELLLGYGYAFYAMLPLVLWFPVLFGIVTPDSIVATGGACTMLGWLRWDRGGKHWRLLLIGGFLLVSVKLNGLLLVSFYAAFYLSLALKRHRLMELRGFIACAVLAYVPYALLWWQYGSPAPDTPAQVAKLSHPGGLVVIPDFLHYILYALREFPRRHVVPDSLWLAGLLALVFALLLIQLARFARRPKACTVTSLATILNATSVAWLATFVIHLLYSYRHYLLYRWTLDFYPRYYLALLPGFCLLVAYYLGQLGRCLRRACP